MNPCDGSGSAATRDASQGSRDVPDTGSQGSRVRLSMIARGGWEPWLARLQSSPGGQDRFESETSAALVKAGWRGEPLIARVASIVDDWRFQQVCRGLPLAPRAPHVEGKR